MSFDQKLALSERQARPIEVFMWENKSGKVFPWKMMDHGQAFIKVGPTTMMISDQDENDDSLYSLSANG
jgi:hypothetical protein